MFFWTQQGQWDWFINLHFHARSQENNPDSLPIHSVENKKDLEAQLQEYSEKHRHLFEHSRPYNIQSQSRKRKIQIPRLKKNINNKTRRNYPWQNNYSRNYRRQNSYPNLINKTWSPQQQHSSITVFSRLPNNTQDQLLQKLSRFCPAYDTNITEYVLDNYQDTITFQSRLPTKLLKSLLVWETQLIML